MRVKVFLLAVVCVSFVQVRGDHHSENPVERGFNLLTKANSFVDTFKTGIQSKTSDEELKEAISKAFVLADSIHSLAMKIIMRQYMNYNDVRNTVTTNATEYINNAREDEERIRKALFKAAENIRDEAPNSDNTRLIMLCINREESKANEKIESYRKTIVQGIERLKNEYNIKLPEVALDLCERGLKDWHNSVITEIKICKNSSEVENVIDAYAEIISHIYDGISEITITAFEKTIAFQNKLYDFYKTMTERIENIYVAAVRDMRKCLYIRETIIAKLLGFG